MLVLQLRDSSTKTIHILTWTLILLAPIPTISRSLSPRLHPLPLPATLPSAISTPDFNLKSPFHQIVLLAAVTRGLLLVAGEGGIVRGGDSRGEGGDHVGVSDWMEGEW